MEKTAAAPFKMMIMCWKGCKCSWSRRRSEAISSSQRWETPISNSNNNNNNMMIIICKSTSPIMHPKKNLNNLPFKFQETAMPTKKKKKKNFSCLLGGSMLMWRPSAYAGWMGGRREHRRSCLQRGLRGSRRQGRSKCRWPLSNVSFMFK